MVCHCGVLTPCSAGLHHSNILAFWQMKWLNWALAEKVQGDKHSL